LLLTAGALGAFDEALREHLGVKLTPVKALVDIPIVDQVSTPKGN
jgi:hypothetical protein